MKKDEAVSSPMKNCQDPIRVADFKRRPPYVYAAARNSGFMHLAIGTHATLCHATINPTAKLDGLGLMCRKCVAKAGTRTFRSGR